MKYLLKLFRPRPCIANANSPLPLAQSGGDGKTSTQSHTPLTEAEVGKLLQSGPVQKVSADFARKLEIKLNEYQRNNGQHPLAHGKASG